VSERLSADTVRLLEQAQGPIVLELFAGCGGASEGIRRAFPDVPAIGVELDSTACATRRAAGHLTIQADVAELPTEPFKGRVLGLWMSPPCPDFSSAGRRKGVEGTSGHLIFQVLRWTLALRPTWLACEQVPPVLPWWQHFATTLQAEGYFTWAGILCAADYGVPQERYRAILMAHAERPVQPPMPTHAERPHPDLFSGTEPLPWVSMAEGLGWGATGGPSPTVTAGGTKAGGAEPLARGGRDRLERERERDRWLPKNAGVRYD
jgi:DNA (cytosine-5)-methyltransferase 1